MTRPFARTLDLISSEYGWSDSQILGMSLERIFQVRDVIVERRSEEREQMLMLEEAKLQNMVGAIYAAAGSKQGVQLAQSIKFTSAKPEDSIPYRTQLGFQPSGDLIDPDVLRAAFHDGEAPRE